MISARRIVSTVTTVYGLRYVVSLITDERIPHSQGTSGTSRAAALRESRRIARNMGWTVSADTITDRDEVK